MKKYQPVSFQTATTTTQKVVSACNFFLNSEFTALPCCYWPRSGHNLPVSFIVNNLSTSWQAFWQAWSRDRTKACQLVEKFWKVFFIFQMHLPMHLSFSNTQIQNLITEKQSFGSLCPRWRHNMSCHVMHHYFHCLQGIGKKHIFAFNRTVKCKY